MKMLVVDDDKKVAKFLAKVFAEEGFIVDVCDRGEDAVRQASTGVYEIVLLDWMLPDVDGLHVCRAIRRAGIATPVLMLTARGETSERVLGLDAGADDFLVKPFELPELHARVRALLRRSTGVGRLVVGPLEIDRLAMKATAGGQRLDLTPKEFAVLMYLAVNAGKVVTRTDLLSHVWDISFDTGSNLVDVQMKRIREKLGELAWMIDTVRGAGYRLIDKPPA